MKRNLKDIKENKLISKYFKKPIKLTTITKERYLELLRDEDKFKYFISIISRKRLSAKDILNYFIYLEYSLEKENIFNKKLIDNICSRLFYISSCGLLKIYNKEIINYIKSNLRAKDFLDEEIIENIKKVKSSVWDDDNFKLIEYEKSILNPNKKDINLFLEKYIKLLKKKYKKKKITKKMYLETISLLKNKLIYKYNCISKNAYDKYISDKCKKLLDV